MARLGRAQPAAPFQFGALSQTAETTGSLSVGLGSITLSTTGSVAVIGSLSQSIGNLTLAGVGTGGLLGALNSSLGDISASSSGAVTVTGTASVSLGSLGLSASGSTPQPTIQELVPYLIGYTQAPAEAVIASIYCVSSVVGTTGTVTAQDPAAFTYVDRGSTITITLGGAINSVSKRKRRGQIPYNSIQ